MTVLNGLLEGDTVAHIVFVLSLVIISGLALGSIKVKGIGLGIAGVLFAGLLAGHWGFRISEPVLEFAREFGLILFVYSIGMQVGPGFFASLRRQGLPLNIMAASIVLLGALITIAISRFAHVPMAAAVGLFSGATTNTPSLGAAQEAIRSLPQHLPGTTELPGLGYAVAYPFGIVGIILTMLALRAIFRINLPKENADLARREGGVGRTLAHLNLDVENPNLNGMALGKLPFLDSLGVVVSRLRQNGSVKLAHPEDVIHTGDTILAIGPEQELEHLRMIVGKKSDLDLKRIDSNLVIRRVVVTKKNVLGKSLGELDLLARHDVTVTRVTRTEVELSATPDQRLQFGDVLLLVGSADDLASVSNLLGNSIKELNHTELIPIFIGIALGVFVGSIPMLLPGIPAPVKLGLAGGPLLVAIVLSRIGHIGSVLWHVPAPANLALREIGIVLFLACVGLHSGEHFLETLLHGGGFQWMALASLITVVPLLLVSVIGRLAFKMNYVTLCGLLAGSMTDPPALAFANAATGSDACSTSYATVYPLTMLLRVVCAQILILLFL